MDVNETPEQIERERDQFALIVKAAVISVQNDPDNPSLAYLREALDILEEELSEENDAEIPEGYLGELIDIVEARKLREAPQLQDGEFRRVAMESKGLGLDDE